jgi:hypothetical protein
VNEKDYPPAAEIGFDLRRRAGDMPLSMMAEYPDFVDRLARHALPGGVFYYVTGAPGTDEANRCMERVRRYRL